MTTMKRKSSLIAMLLVTSMVIFSGCGEKDAVMSQSNESDVVAEVTGEISEEVSSVLNDAPFLAGHSTTIFSKKFY